MDMDATRLSVFSPFNALKKANLRKLVGQVEVLQASVGQKLFTKGDKAKHAVYLLSGTIELRDNDGVLAAITGGSDEACDPISPVLPRALDAIATTDVHYFRVDSELLDVTLTLDQTGIYEIGDFSSLQTENEDDWMTALLQFRLFQTIPAQNIQMIFMRLQRIDYTAGDVVIRQGEVGDYFYVVRSGRCMVTRETSTGQGNIDMAELNVGDTFGEEALISEAQRNATVTMVSDGILMRLAKNDFQYLLAESTLDWIEHDAATDAASKGRKWLDVRLPNEFKASSKPGAINLPLYLLRHKLDVLDDESQYVVYCDTGRRSSAAAFILNQKGFQTAVLKGGLHGNESGSAAA